MNIEEILEKEIKRLSDLNDKLEEYTNGKNEQLTKDICNQIKENALAISEIAKANGFLTENMLKQINKYLGEKY